MNIANELNRILQAKEDIKDAIEQKGVVVGDIRLDEYADKILEIVCDGGEDVIVLGVTGEPASNSQLSRYVDNSYEIDPQLVADENNSNYKYWKWDDTKWPFSEMVEVIEDDNVFIKIPKMYVKLVKDEGNVINERYISNVKLDKDYLLSPIFIDHRDGETELDYFLMSKYQGHNDSGKLTSKSGKEPTGNRTITNFRSDAIANNVGGVLGYQLIDMHAKFILETLYLITFANIDSDSLFPQGNTGNTQNNGILDDMDHHTGYTTGLSNYLMKFIGIENYFSNMLTFVDGFKANNSEVFVCDNPEQYNSNNNTTNYYSIGNMPTTSGNIIAEGTTVGLFSIPFTTDGLTNYTSYYSDRIYQSSSDYRILYFGRYYNFYAYSGLFFFHAYHHVSYTNSSRGSRLVKKPLV